MAVKSSWLNDRGVRAVLAQIAVLAIVILVVADLTHNTIVNLDAQHIATGFGFLSQTAGFAIGESLIPYEPTDSYTHAFAVGLVNTLMVAVLGIVFCTTLGLLVGIARLSSNWLLARLASIYVESLRNVPVLLQLFLWYDLIGQAFPNPRLALNVFGVIFLSNRGFKFPLPVLDGPLIAGGVALLVAVAAAVLWTKAARQHQLATGQLRPILLPNLAAIILLPVIVSFAFGGLTIEVPELHGFNFAGGGTISPELAALVIGLSLYTSSFVAEVVRGGILSVSKGQSEAARALGMREGWIMRLVILPQALRVIIPPLMGQYLNLIKNSSLAVLIGFPDLVQTINTAINQTGQSIEGVAIMMVVYLSISLSVSAALGAFNKRVRLIER